MPQPTPPSALAGDVQKLFHDLIAADEQLDTARAYGLARTLCEGGWRHPDAGSGEARRSGGIPAERVHLGTRFILRFTFTGEAASPAEEVASVATQFTREGATVLGVNLQMESAELELLASVEQALRVLTSMGDVPADLLASWLCDAGYTGDVEERVKQLLIEGKPGPELSAGAPPRRGYARPESRRGLN